MYDLHSVLASQYSHFSKLVEYDSKLGNTEFWQKIADNKGINHLFFSFLELNLKYSLTDYALEK